MAMVSIAYDKCSSCLLCVEASPRCFSSGGGAITPTVDEHTCVLCGHCVAACPSEAITHHVMDMGNFPPIGREQLIETDRLIQFIRERRSHRAFLNKPIPRKDLEKLIDTVRYAPTGHNDQTVEIVIVENPERRKRLSNLAVDRMAVLAKESGEKLDSLKQSGKGGHEEIMKLEGLVAFQNTLVAMRDDGFDPIFYEAPAVAIFHSTTDTVTPKDNGVIASTTMGLLARTMGLATTYIALFENAANAHKPLKDELGLPSGHRVYSVLVLGYPRVQYLRAVDRKPIRTRWE